MRTTAPIVLDLETTGVQRSNQIVSAGLLVDGVAYILFARSLHATVPNLAIDTFRAALRPLQRPDLIIIGHNLPFDLRFLRREGFDIHGEIRDTLKLLRLIDQDRGHYDTSAGDEVEGFDGKGGDVQVARLDRRAPGGPVFMNYRLKDVAAQLLGLRMPHFPGQIELAPYDIHARYLACDLLGTKRLYDYLWPQLTVTEREYYRTLVSPIVHVLGAMTHAGVQTDAAFAHAEATRLETLMQQLSAQHLNQFGVALGMDGAQMTQWLFASLALPILKRKRAGRRWVPSLDSDVLKQLAAWTDDERARESLALILDYRQATSLLVRLRTLPRHADSVTGRAHSTFDDRQATGRVSSTYPNLQQLAKPKTIAGAEFRTRNFLRASDGYTLAVFDIGQADVRALAHAVESFLLTSDQYRQQVRTERDERLATALRPYDLRSERQNPGFKGTTQEYPQFSPELPADLAADFQDTTADFYSIAAQRILKRPPADKAERDRFKVIILSTVNGQGPTPLAKALTCSKAEAKTFLRQFEQAYPKVAAFKELMHWQIAHTGKTTTFLGRPRTITAHHWLVTEPRVQILVSYKDGEVYWLDVVPLEPHRRVLTTYVLKAWDAKTTKLIYDHQRGRLSGRPRRLFEETGQYLLPVRNWGWRSIRHVRCGGEEASYEGFDATARAAFNFICQGGTADICKLMMLRCQPVCERFGARLLIQIHDELVFEVPTAQADAFFAAMVPVLQQPPIPDFRVPIIVEAKRGDRFGELTPLARS